MVQLCTSEFINFVASEVGPPPPRPAHGPGSWLPDGVRTSDRAPRRQARQKTERDGRHEVSDGDLMWALNGLGFKSARRQPRAPPPRAPSALPTTAPGLTALVLVCGQVCASR